MTTAGTDADNDPVTYDVIWTVNGAPYAAGGGTVTSGAFTGWVGAATTVIPGDTVPVADVTAGQTWSCSVTPHDGEADGESTSTTTVVSEGALVASWSLDDGEARDTSGNGLGGSVMGAVSSAGQVGTSLDFDGMDDVVAFGSDRAFDMTSAVTVAAWVNSAGDNDYAGVLTHRSCCDDATDFVWSLQTHDDGNMAFGVQTGAGVAWSGLSAFPTGEWTFFVGAYDGSTVAISANGLLASSTPASGPIVTRDIEVVLGARADAAGYGDFWNGEIDAVRLWNRALLPEEVAQTFDAER